MKGLYFSDIHTFPFNEFSRPTTNGRTTLIEEHERTYEWVAQNIEEEKPDFVVFIGDTALTHGYLDSLSLTTITQGYHRVREACQTSGSELFWLLGNHDFLNDASRVHSLPFIKEIVSEIDVRDGLLFIPFYRDRKDWERYREYLNRDVKRAFVHLDIQGARYNNSSNICTAGISPTDLAQVKTFAGHFHHPQDLSEEFHVIGSCMYRNFNDDVVDLPRGLVLDFDGWRDYRENPHTSIYQTLRQDTEDPATFRGLLRSVKYPKRTFVRVIYPQALQKVLDTFDEFKGIRAVPIRERKKTAVAVPDLPSSFDPHKVVDTYVSLYPPTAAEPDKVLQYGHDLVTEVLGKVLKAPQRRAKFLSGHIENFLSIQNMDVRFDDEGVIYVDGQIEGRESDVSNGAGKSSIFESLFWCHFGELIRSDDKIRTSSVDDVINNQSKHCLVSYITIIDDIEYQFVRTRRHPEHGDDFMIYQEGRRISQGITNSQKMLKEILGIDSEIFRHVAFFVDSLNTRFSSLSGKQRMELVESVIQLRHYDELYTVAHNQYRTLEAKVEASKNSQERNLTIVKELMGQREQLALTLEESERGLTRVIEQRQEEAQHLLSQRDVLSQDLQAKAKIVESLEPGLVQARESLQAEVKYSQNCNQTISKIQSQIAVLKHQIQAAKQAAEGVCPTCKRPFDRQNTSELVQQVQVLESQVQDLDKLQADWQGAASASAQRQASLQTRLNDLQGGSSLIQGKVQAISSQISQIEAQRVRIASDIVTMRRQIDTARQSLRGIDSRIQLVQSENEILAHQLKGLETQAKIASYWDLGFAPNGGCRICIIQEAVRQLSDYAVDYASFLSDGFAIPTLSIGPKNVIIVEAQTQGRKYGLSSGGERRMIDLPIQLALSRLSSRYSGFTCNLMALDEVEDKLDAAARRRLIGLLNRIATNEHKMILIASQYKDLKSYVDKVWTVHKIDGFSTLRTDA